MATSAQQLDICDSIPMLDIVVTSIGKIEDIGYGLVRLHLTNRQTVGGREEEVVVAKIVIPKVALTDFKGSIPDSAECMLLDAKPRLMKVAD